MHDLTLRQRFFRPKTIRVTNAASGALLLPSKRLQAHFDGFGARTLVYWPKPAKTIEPSKYQTVAGPTVCPRCNHARGVHTSLDAAGSFLIIAKAFATIDGSGRVLSISTVETAPTLLLQQT